MALVFTQLASDTFTRTDENPLNPSKWVPVVPNPIDSPPFEVLAVVSDLCVSPTSASNHNTGGEQYVGVPLPSNQYVSFTIETLTANGVVGAGIRSDNTTFVGYEVFIPNGPLGSGVPIEIDNVGPSGGTLASTTTTINSGDVITLAAVGSNLFALVNGVIVLTATDSTYTSGTTFLEMVDGLSQDDVQVSSYAVGSVMSIGFITGQKASTGTPGNAGSVAFPLAVTTGDLLVVQFVSQSGSAQTPVVSDTVGGGNVWIQLFSGVLNDGVHADVGWHAAWYCFSAFTGSDTVSFSGGLGGTCGINIAGFTGVNALDQQSTFQAITDLGNCVSNPITTTQANEIIVGFGVCPGSYGGSGGGTCVAPLTFVVETADGFGEHLAQIGYEVVSSIKTNYTEEITTVGTRTTGLNLASFYEGSGAAKAKPVIIIIG